VRRAVVRRGVLALCVRFDQCECYATLVFTPSLMRARIDLVRDAD